MSAPDKSSKNFFPLIAAVSLTILWGLMLIEFPRALLLLPSLGTQMPLPTLLTNWVFRLLNGAALPLLVLATALLLGFHQFVAWVYALVLCGVWDVAFVGLILPIVDNFKSGYIADLSFFLPTTLAPVQWVFVAGAFLLNQALFVWLLIKRRDFAR